MSTNTATSGCINPAQRRPYRNLTAIPDDNLQSVINIIRDWVLNQTEPFTIYDIYSKPRMSEKLACTKANILLLDEALITLRCTTEQDPDNTPMKLLRYIPPKPKRVRREEINP